MTRALGTLFDCRCCYDDNADDDNDDYHQLLVCGKATWLTQAEDLPSH